MEKIIDANLCENCPARTGKTLTAQLRGSSFRGRLIEEGEAFEVDTCVFMVSEVLVGIVQIANIDAAATEKDVEVLTSSFEGYLPGCTKPSDTATAAGSDSVCTPINSAVDDFMAVNYPEPK